MSMQTITVNDRNQTVPDGMNLLQALNYLGCDVPSLCYDARLKAIGGCRLCLVQVAGRGNYWGRSPINFMSHIKPNGVNPCLAEQE